MRSRPPIPPAKMRTLGVIGGTSWHSTVEYYRLINEAINRLHGNNTNPPLLICNLNQHEIHALQLRGGWGDIQHIFANAVKALRRAGAEAVLFAANTPHKVYSEVRRATKAQILHIGDAAGAAIREAHLTKVGLIGTLYTMEDGFMQEWLRSRHGITVSVPRKASARKEVHRIIQEELAMGLLLPETKQYVLEQISDLAHNGAEAIILGCTEFTLIVNPSDVSLPLFDTTRLHCEMAVDFILGHRYQANSRPSRSHSLSL